MDTITRYFFLLHIPITLLVDLSPLYPDTRLFAVPHFIRNFYLSTFNDPVLSGASDPGGWFKSLLLLEGVVQLPICVFVVVQYARKRQTSLSTRLIISGYSVQVATATWACIWESMAFTHLSTSEKISQLGFYLPYLIVPVMLLWHNASSLHSQAQDESRELSYLRKYHSTHHKPTEVPVIRIMITGANSGVGLGIALRLIDQSSQAMLKSDLTLCLILSVRSQEKANSILQALATQQAKFGQNLALEFVFLDLTSMKSVELAARKLKQDFPNGINTIICNAGMAQFDRIDILKATKQALRSPIAAISEPDYKIQRVGGTTEDEMGTTFQANFFGHFYLIGRLEEMNILKATGPTSSIIWMSSLEATAAAFVEDDMQAVAHDRAYESSKRLMDTMWSQAELTTKIPQFLVHPGFCSTNIVAETMPASLVPIIGSLWTATFYFARFCGSIYHTATAYNGAYVAAKVALNPDAYSTKEKLGSAGRWDGTMFVSKTAFDPIDSSQAERLVRNLTDLRNTWRRRLAN